MKTVPLREAEVLSYLQGYGAAYDWVRVPTCYMMQDLRRSLRSQLCHEIGRLRRRGFIDIRYGISKREYRVLVRVERLLVIDCGSMSTVARERQRAAALKREAEARRRRLVPYAGYAGAEI